jgi:ADP-ribose pyrophosphatase YjhB (NUDIX family)
MAQESADNRWSLPGGWADIGHTPSQVIEREVFEETGMQVKAERLLAVFDKKCHPHPPEPHYAYKFVFGCSLKGGELKNGFDMLDVGFFALDHLPPLSEVRILESQIRLAYDKWTSGDMFTYFD